MERFAWKALIKEGMLSEYIRRHDEIWSEMKEVLKKAGICNYSIWTDGREVFGYFECQKGIAFAEEYQVKSVVVDKWNEYMKDILDMKLDPLTGAQPKMRQIFYLN